MGVNPTLLSHNSQPSNQTTPTMPRPTPQSPPSKDHLISREITAFLLDCRARQLSPRTLESYSSELSAFQSFLASQKIRLADQITADHIRLYLASLSPRRNPGGVHIAYRVIKTLLRWFEREIDDPAYRNPIARIKPPKVNTDPLPGITKEHIHALLATCDKTPTGQRDKAILYTLIDTGLRKSEITHLDFGDLNLTTGAVHVRSGKGDKDRAVYLGYRSRREILRYLRYRGELLPNSPLWTTETGVRLTPSGLRQIVRRRAARAGIPEPGLHDFRRHFALESLRNGIDLATLARLMGHSSLVVLQRYLKLITDDLQRAHEHTSPADNL